MQISFLYKHLVLLRRVPFYSIGLLLMSSIVSAATDIESVRLWRSPESTRLVLDLSDRVEHKLLMLKNPSRVVIDLANTRLKGNFDGFDLTKTPIVNVRHAARNGDDLRIVLDLSATVSPKSFTLPANEQYGHRLVLDLFDKRQQVSKTLERVIQRADRKIVIAIDAGHGGEDPGASGPNRLREKHSVKT